jgi:hypothetical protein
MSLSIVQLPYEGAKSGSITIKPYFDPDQENQGLEKYGMVLFDGVFHEEQLACIERNGIHRYLTGLNEFAPEVKLIKDPEERDSKIKEIRTVVAQLEKDLAANVIDPEDSEFWNKVKLLKPDNDEFWNKISLRCGNEPVILDPGKDPYDLIKLYAIEAGGFPMVAKSFERARSQPKPSKFYLDKAVETVAAKTEVKKLKNKALSELDSLFYKNSNKLLYVAKVVDGNSAQYRKSTPVDVIYDNMDKFINGDGVEQNLRRAAKTFIDTAALDMETLKIKALIKDATFYKFITPKSDGFIYEVDDTIKMGRNVSDCVEFLKNPLNDEVLLKITNKVEFYWNQ